MSHKFFIRKPTPDAEPGVGIRIGIATMNPLIRLWFDNEPHNTVNFFCVAA